MKQLVRDCDNELAEIDLIESYRRDEGRENPLKHNLFAPPPSISVKWAKTDGSFILKVTPTQ
jgi:hypothetical protein